MPATIDLSATPVAFTLLLFAACTLAAAQQPDSRHPAPSMPSWLVSYPGVTPDVQKGAGIVQTSYTTPAKPAEVVEHYRKLFESAGLRFQPNPDGMGTVIRGAASECDLLIVIHQESAGTFVDLSCTSKSPASAASSAKEVEIIGGGSSSLPRP